MKIQIFHSFEEMEEYEARESAKIDPITGLAQTLELIPRVWCDT
jgi:hypothetical protein